jgi:hypothetical protein
MFLLQQLLLACQQLPLLLQAAEQLLPQLVLPLLPAAAGC